MPVAIAPVGLTGMQHADGEILAAKAAEKFGIPFTLSTMSICSIEDIAGNTTAPFWFQLYMMRDRDAMVRMIQRAKAARCSALVLTLDLAGDRAAPQRPEKRPHGTAAPTLANIINLMTKLVSRHARHQASHLRQPRRPRQSQRHEIAVVLTNEQFDPRVSWPDVKWVKEQWGGKLIPKGIQDVEDAKLAVESGADAIVVSNHGGRQLDGAENLHPRVARHRCRCRRQDRGAHGRRRPLRPGCAQAWAPGAKGVWIGRAMAYGLGRDGEAGVTKALQIIHKELDVSMAFCGHTNIQNVDKQILCRGRIRWLGNTWATSCPVPYVRRALAVIFRKVFNDKTHPPLRSGLRTTSQIECCVVACELAPPASFDEHRPTVSCPPSFHLLHEPFCH